MPFSREYREILVVEDNDDDFEATERALTGAGQMRHTIHRCRDGMEGWRYLKGDENGVIQDDSRLPGLILLDLNMPGLDGRRFLAKLKNDPMLCSIPVVVMTTSDDSQDVKNCYEAGANTYLCKPVRWSDFSKAVAQLRDYWFGLAVTPDLERGR